MNKCKNVAKEVLKYFLTFLIMIVIFCLSMIFSYALPNGSIRKNVSDSANVLTEYNNNPIFSTYVPGGELDTYTDRLILSTALNKGKYEKQSVIERAFENSHYNVEKVNALELKEIIANQELYDTDTYSRYWHGIQTIIRPMLMLFNYEEIRYIFYIVISILLTISAYLIYRNIGLYQTFAYIISLTLICIYIVPSSLQYMGIFVVSIVGLIVVNILYMNDKEKYYPYLFIIIGGLAAFFDLLTIPILSVGLPIMMIAMIKVKNKEKIKDIFIYIIWYSALWVISYGLMFISKWIIASAVLHRNEVTSAIDQLLFRFNGNEEHPTTKKIAIVKNIKYLATNKAFVFSLIVIIATWIILMTKRGKKIIDIKYILVYAFIALYPYIWYFVIAGHSTVHAWFTHRAQVVSIFAFFVALIECLEAQKNKVIGDGTYRNNSSNKL